MAMTKQYCKNDCLILRTIEELVPKDHLVRMIDECMDFKFIEDKVKHLYSTIGRHSIPPIVLFKLLMINKIFGINSMRQTCEECEVNLAYRWFLGLSIEDKIPNYSTWSKNYERRYKDSDIFNEIFEEVLSQAMEYGFIETEAVFYDGTHQKANANNRKYTDEEVEIEAKNYKEDLLNEINNVRKEHNQKEVKQLINEELDFDEQTGEEVTKIKTKHIKVSTTDKDSGHYHKGEHEQCFAYTHNTATDKNGFVLAHETVPGNVHDSVSFDKVREKVMKKFGAKITFEVLDAGFKTPAICRTIIEDNKIPLMPYTRPKGSKELINKKEFTYNKEKDIYICPNNEILTYKTVTKEGLKIYKSNPEKCINCPFKEKCTKSKTNQKSISRHVWEEYVEIYVNLLKTTDGVHYDLVCRIDIKGFANEATLRFLNDGRMAMLLRRDEGDCLGYWGVSEAPYTQWDLKPIGFRLGGPNFLVRENGKLIMGTRSYLNPQKHMTALFKGTPEGKWEEVYVLPHGGDTSYPGLLIEGDKVWVSYYATVDNHCAIYLAKLPLNLFD